MTGEPIRSATRHTDPPLIGISASEVREAKTLRQTREGEPPGCEIALGIDYVAAITRAGGLPLIIPPVDTGLIDDLLDRLDGICLSGGPDIDPAAYGAERDPEVGPTDSDVDRFEIELARLAVNRNMPVLAICRGMQVLNVGFGGSLIQHLPDVSDTRHRQDEPGQFPGHPITIDAESRLASIAGSTAIEVNTFHHQAIDRLGDGLRVIARAPDDTVEAVESPRHSFVLGLQWHAELMAGRETESRIFDDLIQAASVYGRRGLERAPN